MSQKLPIYIKILDTLLYPIMFAFNGFNKTDVQKTHPWHIKSFNKSLLSSKNTTLIKGKDTSKVKDVWFGLFHMPIFGGWKNYVVLEPINYKGVWFLGWSTQKHTQLNKIPISGAIKALEGPKGNTTYFFAIDKNKNFIELKVVARGKIGDEQYKNLPLL
jgi:hypothetical protein